MIKYRRCLFDGVCQLKRVCPMTGKEGKRCALTSGTCEHQGIQMVMATKDEEMDGRLIIDAIEGRI